METDDGRSRQIGLEREGGRGAETVWRPPRGIVSRCGDALDRASERQTWRCGTGDDGNNMKSTGRNGGSRIWSCERHRQPSDVVIVVRVVERCSIVG
jgi:hypothetical protein